ncbi:serine hydrolase domain-containing protein [Lysobacter korlensis]|uniref:Beta-lactamase n=1 Tax=Lysobacter korlensis TaxID=553636 RepID=A0ABV6RNF0_9GAMM
MTFSPDEVLADALRRRIGSRHPVAAAATVSAGRIGVSALGATLDADFELGSISKGITGLLYADAIERGEVRPESTLGELLPLHGSAAAGVTLAALSTHTSGLPSIPPAAQPLRRSLRLWTRGSNPYGQTLDQVLKQTRTVTLSTPRPRYSNLGFQLLGHAVASAAGRSYTELLRDRLTEPLGLTTMYAPSRPADLRPAAILGRDRRGRAAEAWTGEALAPAGGIRSSIADAAGLARALLDGSAPGTAALDPVRNYTGPAVRIGAGWITLETRGRQITWHNGGTGGFRTWIGLDRAAATAVVLLSATAVSVDRHGMAMLRELGE